MADPEKLSQQPIAQSPGAESDLFYSVQAGQTRRMTRSILRTAIVSTWQTFIGDFLSSGSPAAARTAIGAVSSSDNITGSAGKLTTSRNIAATGDATWNVNFDGSAGVTAALTLAASGVVAGTLGAVTVDAKGRATGGSTVCPIANGGTGQSTISAAAAALAAPKLAWTSYTPTVTASSGTYTAASATGSYTVVSGICHVRIKVTITTKGTGSLCNVALPLPALSGSSGLPLLIKGSAVNFVQGAAVISVALTGLLLTDYLGGDIISGDGAVVDIAGSYPIA